MSLPLNFSGCVISAIAHYADTTPEQIALRDGCRSYSYRALQQAVNCAAEQLQTLGVQRIALRSGNSVDWAIADLAAIKAGLVVIPVALFFTVEQCQHLLNTAAIDAVWGERWDGLADNTTAAADVAGLPLYTVDHTTTAELHTGTAKVTFTSGSTATPKGVCLAQHSIDRVSADLATALVDNDQLNEHFVLLPLSTLLENITGVYVPLLLGKTSLILSAEDTGLSGSNQFDGLKFYAALDKYRPNSLVLTPALLEALMMVVQHNADIAQSLHFIAVGGARVSPALLAQAQALQLPVYEGYGLSECASVVSLNLPGNSAADTCGKPLIADSVSIADDGEIIIHNQSMLGYIGEPTAGSTIASGDLGFIDAAGYLHISGRKKNQIITSFGRNVSPEWLESNAQSIGQIQQIVIFGDGEACLSAVVVSTSEADARQGVALLNATLPDYARIQHSVFCGQRLEQIDGLTTANGRPKRAAIKQYFGDLLTINQDLLSQPTALSMTSYQHTTE